MRILRVLDLRIPALVPVSSKYCRKEAFNWTSRRWGCWECATRSQRRQHGISKQEAAETNRVLCSQLITVQGCHKAQKKWQVRFHVTNNRSEYKGTLDSISWCSWDAFFFSPAPTACAAKSMEILKSSKSDDAGGRHTYGLARASTSSCTLEGMSLRRQQHRPTTLLLSK